MTEKRVATVNCLKADCSHHPTQSRNDVPLSQFLLDVSLIPCESHVVLLGIPRIEGICSEEINIKGAHFAQNYTCRLNTASLGTLRHTLESNSQLSAVTQEAHTPRTTKSRIACTIFCVSVVVTSKRLCS